MTHTPNTTILKFSGSAEISSEQAGRLAFQKDYQVTLTGEIRADMLVPLDTGENNRILRLRVSEVKEIE